MSIRLKNYPTPSKTITSTFAERWGKFHPGIDIAPLQFSIDGDPLWAVADGKIVVSKVNGGGVLSGYGYYTIIQHDGFHSLYGHQIALDKKVGDHVSAGNQIGRMGHTGSCVSSIPGATGTHLHFGLYEGVYSANTFSSNIAISKALNPEIYLRAIEESKVKTFDEIIKLPEITTQSAKWITTLNTAQAIAEAVGNLGDLEIIKYVKPLLEKVYNATPAAPNLSWYEILPYIATSHVEWVKSITAMVSVAQAAGNVGDLELLQFFPDLIEKAYYAA